MQPCMLTHYRGTHGGLTEAVHCDGVRTSQREAFVYKVYTRLCRALFPEMPALPAGAVRGAHGRQWRGDGVHDV